MPVKTIIVNGDEDWDFGSILLSHALDLYRVDTSVFFRNCAPANSAAGGAFSVLANFPEDFSQDPFALEAEVREDLRDVFRNGDASLSMAIILNRQDLVHFVQGGAKWDSHPMLSDPAKAALKALQAATRLVQQQVDQENVVSLSTTRVWFAIVVRDAGSSSHDRELAEGALAILNPTATQVHNAFLLSNGMDQDQRMSEQVEHFVKLRGLIDVFGQEASSQARSQIRTSQKGGVEIAHVRLPQGAPRAPGFSAVLREGLISEISRLDAAKGQSKDGDRTEKFEKFTSEVRSLIPSEWTEKTYQSISSHLDSQVESKRNENVEASGLRSSELANADAKVIIDDLSRPSFVNKLFLFRRKPDFYAKLQAKYESAFNISRQTYGDVVDAEITTDRGMASKNRPQLVHAREDLVLPTAVDGEALVSSFQAKLEDERAQMTSTIAGVRDMKWKLERDEDGGAHEREMAFKVAQLAENNLMGPSGLFTIFKVFAISLLPVVVFYGMQYLDGISPFSTWTELFKALGVLGYVVAFSAVGAVFAGGLTAFRLAKKRRIAVKQLTARLRKNFDTLRGLAASRLALTRNRIRLSDLQMVTQALSAREATSSRNMTRDLADLLMQSNGGFPAPVVSETDEKRLLEAATAGFLAGGTDSDRIRNYLARRETPAERKLTLVESDMGNRSSVISTFAHLTDTELQFGEPGYE